MNTVKKMIALLLMLGVVLSFGACGQPDENAAGTTQGQTTVEIPTEAPTTEAPEETVDPNLVVYTVYIVDEENNPVTGGMIQFCLNACAPVIIDENGVAQYTGEAADYEVKFLTMPAGYTYSTEEEVFHFEPGETEMTLVVKPEA